MDWNVSWPSKPLAARGSRSRKDGFPTVGAVCDRPHFVNSRKNARSETAPTIGTANSADFCHGLLAHLLDREDDDPQGGENDVRRMDNTCTLPLLDQHHPPGPPKKK